LVGRLPRRRQFPLSALLFRQFRPRRQLCVLLGSRVGLVDSARPPHHRRCGAHSPVPADRRAGLPRRAVAVPLVPHRPVGEAPGRHGVGCVGDLQRSTLDGSAARAVIPLLTRRLILAAVRPGGAVDRMAMLLSYLGVSFPVYWVGLLLILVFAVALQWLPPSGSGGLAYLVLPALTLGMRSIAFLARMTRAAMLEVL